MRVLHLFDWYLPSTLSWVSRLLLYLKNTEVWIGAPWIVENHFYHKSFKHFRFPLQPQGLLQPKQEGQYAGYQRLLSRSQRFFPTYPYWLEGQLRKDPPEILHAHFGPTGCLYLPLAQKLNRPLVVTFYGFDYKKILNDRPVFHQKYRTLFAGAAKVLAASPTGCAALEAMGCPAEKLAIVRPSPDLDLFPFQEGDKPAGRLNLVQAATFTAKKGQLIALEAFRLALPGCPNMQLTFAGEPYDRNLFDQVNQYIRQYQLESHVSCLPPLDHRQMAGFLAGFDAFIHPSCHTASGDHEATPVVLLEAQATGLPVLATRHFDLPDQVREGHSGFLVPENDVPALAEAIRKMYEMPKARYSQFSQNARKWVEQGFTAQASAAALEKFYGELI